MTANVTATEFSEETIKAIVKRLTPLRKSLFSKPDNEYWKIKGEKLKSLEVSNEVNFKNGSVEENIKVRISISEKLSNATKDQVSKYYEWVVKDWGGITSVSGIEEIVKVALDEKNKKRFNLNRVASWSKCLSFMHPEEYAIYDARAVYSLNAVLYEAGLNEGESFFPNVAGRNSTLTKFDITTIILLDEITKNSNTIRGAWVKHLNSRSINKKSEDDEQAEKFDMPKPNFIPKNNAYAEYTKLLKRVNEKLFADFKLGDEFDKSIPKDLTKYPYLTEMILFYYADKDILAQLIENYPKYKK